MSSQNIFRRIARLAFAQNTQLPTIDVPRNIDIKSIMIRVDGLVDMSAPVTPRAWQTDIIRRIQLVVGGALSIADMAFTDLVYANFQRALSVSALPASGAGAATPFSFMGILDLQNYDGIRPTDSTLHTSGLSLLQLIINTGENADIGSGGAVIDTANTFITVSILESVEDEVGEKEPRFTRKISTQRINITASNTELKIPLSRGGLLRAISLRSLVGDPQSAPTDLMIRNITFGSGTDVRFNLSYADVLAMNAQDYVNYSTVNQAGIAIMDLASDKLMTHLYNLAAVTEADVTLDVVPQGAPGTRNQALLTIYEFLAKPTA